MTLRPAVLSALCWTLASCGTPSPPPVETVAPPAVDPRVCASTPAAPAIPNGATIPAAVTLEEQTATSLFLNWVAAMVDHAGVLASRVDLARSEACDP